MTIEKLRPSFTFDQERLAALSAIAPEAFADGKINWEALKAVLGEHLEDEEQDAEHFGLFWPGKRAARRLASLRSMGALKPVPGEGVNEATTRHVFIEGDNLEVLKLLQKSYAGRVKVIYIDPPYNTGNDFIYSDNFTEPLEEYLRATGQADEMGRVLVTNTKSGGRYHSNWLNMMYPRLRLARNLLRDDGLLFVSIDDKEVHNLRSMLNEVFGEENFLALCTWRGMHTVRNSSQHFNQNTEYIVVTAKNTNALFDKERATWLRVPRDKSADYPYDEDDGKGPYKLDPLHARNYYTPYEHTFENGVTWSSPEGRYPAYSQDSLRSMEVEGEIAFPGDSLTRKTGEKTAYGGSEPMMKRFLERVLEGVPPDTLLPSDEVGFSKDGTDELQQLFGGKVFDQPKPTALISYLLSIDSQRGRESKTPRLILDFFAGTCTTAHAVMLQNRKVGIDDRFVVVQLPEITAPGSGARQAGYATITDIGKERIRRVIQRLKSGTADQLPVERETPEDLGFKVFKLDRSNFKAWRDFDGGDVGRVETLFARFESPLVEGWKAEDVLVEVLLTEGFPLDSTVTPAPNFAANSVQVVTSDLLAHRLFVCLDAAIFPATIAALVLGDDDIFICLDSALSDEAKVQLEDSRRVKVI